MIVPDVNLLLYAVHESSPFHHRANQWLQAALDGDEPIGLPWLVVLGFLRITTNPRIYSTSMRSAYAVSVVNDWLSRSVVSAIEPGQEHWRILSELLAQTGTAGNLTTDAHLAALCIERGATLHSADTDFARFRSLNWVNPIRI